MRKDGPYRNSRVVAGNGNVDVGHSVAFAAGMKERGEPLRIARQGPVRGLGHAPLHYVQRAIQPDGEAVAQQQFAIGRLRERASAQCQYRWPASVSTGRSLAASWAGQ